MNKWKAIAELAIAGTWVFMGLYAKVLDMMPRHRWIVARVLDDGSDAYAITASIGLIEILIGVWVMSRRRPILCAVSQTVALATMNAFELSIAPDLLVLGYAHVLATLAFLVLAWFVALERRQTAMSF